MGMFLPCHTCLLKIAWCAPALTLLAESESVLGMSSTWCCNPQFRVTTVRKACDVVVCLSQQDPTVLHRTHVRKALRRRTVGLQVRPSPTSLRCGGRCMLLWAAVLLDLLGIQIVCILIVKRPFFVPSALACAAAGAMHGGATLDFLGWH